MASTASRYITQSKSQQIVLYQLHRVIKPKPVQVLKRSCPAIVVLSAIIFAAPSRVYAWNPTAHQIAAYIAYKRLDGDVQKKVIFLLSQHASFKEWRDRIKKGGDPYVRSRPRRFETGDPEFDLNLFLLASLWADEIKHPTYRDRFKVDNNPPISDLIFPDSFQHRAWHFVDLPFSTDGTPYPPDPPSPNMRDVLPVLRNGIGNSQLDSSAQSFDLAWLIHLIGDAHQPLHCATRFSKAYSKIGDSGGNSVQITSEGLPTTLHIYWDRLLGTYSIATFKREAQRIEKTYKPKTLPVDFLSEKLWIDESFEIAKNFAYSIDPPPTMGTPKVDKRKYDAEAKIIARKQIVLAGYRLAGVLNERLK